MRLILGSASPARLQTLRQAGLDPEVIVSDVDEDSLSADTLGGVALVRARAKGEAVLGSVFSVDPNPEQPTVVLACDSMLEIEGHIYGKPGSAEAAIVRWYRMRGRQGLLHTGHYAAVVNGSCLQQACRLATTEVTFADLSDEEIAAYAATGEPERVAGAFTIDGYGGPFVTRISGDPHNVVGISLPLVRQMLIDMGVSWHALWGDRRSDRI